MGDALGNSAFGREGVEINSTVVVRAECDGLSIGRKSRRAFKAQRTGHRLRDAAIFVHHPQIVAVTKDDRVFGDVGIAAEAVGFLGVTLACSTPRNTADSEGGEDAGCGGKSGAAR